MNTFGSTEATAAPVLTVKLVRLVLFIELGKREYTDNSILIKEQRKTRKTQENKEKQYSYIAI